MFDDITYLAGDDALQFVVEIDYEDVLTDVETSEGETIDYDEFNRNLLRHIAFHGVDSITVRLDEDSARGNLMHVEVIARCCHGAVEAFSFTYAN